MELHEEAVHLIHEFEIDLRSFIKSSLSEVYGDWTKGIPNKPTGDRKDGMLDRWKRKRELESIKGVETSEDFIDQAEFSDYKQIIESKSNWKKVFSVVFHESNKSKLSQYLDDLNDFRNKVFHSKGTIKDHEIGSAKNQIKWFERKIKPKYMTLFDDERLSKRLSDSNEVYAQEIEKPFQDSLDIMLQKSLESIRERQNYEEMTSKYDELLVLIKKEIDAWNSKNFCFGMKESFLAFYPYFDKLRFTFDGLKELIVYSHNVRRTLVLDIISELQNILGDATLGNENTESILPCADLLLEIALEFMEKDFEITEYCFRIIDDAAEDVIWHRLLSRLIILGAKITQATDQTRRMESFRDQITQSLEFDDEAAWEDNYFSYLWDSYFHVESKIEITEERDIEVEYDISLSQFYDEYIGGVVEKNKNKFIERFVDYLEHVSFEDYEDELEDIDSLAKYESEQLDGAFEAYVETGVYPNFLKELSAKLAEKKSKTESKKFTQLLTELNEIASGHLKQVISTAVK